MRFLFLVGCVCSTFANAGEVIQKSSNPIKPPTSAMKISADLSVGVLYDDWTGVYDVIFEAPWGDSAIYGTIDGRMLLPLSDNVGLQFEGSSTKTIDKVDEVASYSAASHVGAHILFRNELYQFGLLGGVGKSTVDNDEEWRSSIIGIEGQLYFEQISLWLQLNQIRSFEPDYDYERYDPIQFRMGARYFLSPNTRFDFEGGYTSGKFFGSTLEDSVADANLISWKLGAEFMFPGDTSSISLFTFYAGGHIIDDKTNPIFFVGGSQHSVMAGVRIKFGDNSLFSQDRSGINTDMTFSALPVIDALYGVGELPDW